VIANLGGETIASGFLGGTNGAYVRHVLDTESVPHHFTVVAGATRINFAVEDHSGLPPTTFNEPGPTVSTAEVERLLVTLRHNLKTAAWLLAAGSTPPGLSSAFFGVLGTLAREHSVLYAVDADGDNLHAAISSGPVF